MNAASETGPHLALECAVELLDKGLWPVAIKPGGKAPIGHEWGMRRPTLPGLQIAFVKHPRAGLGIALGPGRGPGGKWLIDLEIDGPRGDESFDRLMGGEEVDTIAWRSALGPHRLFELDEADALRLVAALSRLAGKGSDSGVFKPAQYPDLELRIGGHKADGTIKQLQSVTPPTVGDDGKPRAYCGGRDILPLPESAIRRIEREADEAERAARPAPAPEPDGLPVGGDVPRTQHPGAGRPDALLRARSYLAKCDAAISGQRGHDKTFGVACRVGPGFDLPEEVAFRLIMEDYSPRCEPPWSEREARHKVTDAYRKEARRGWLLDADRPDFAPANGQPRENAHAGALAEPPRLSLKVIDAESVLIEPVEFLYEPHLPLGMLTLVGGLGGVGKSQMLLDIAAAATAGRPILGMPADTAIEPCDVLILANEDPIKSMAKPRLLASGAELKRVEFVEGIQDQHGGFMPFDLNHVGLLEEHLEQGRRSGRNFRLVLIDPLTTYVGRARIDDHRDAQLKPALELVAKMAERAALAALANAHLNKSVGGKVAAHRVMGGGAYVTSSRVVYLYGPNPDDPESRCLVVAKFNTPLRPPAVIIRKEPIAPEEALRIIAPHAAHLTPERKAKLAAQLSRLAYTCGGPDITAESVLEGEGERPGRAEKAADFLRRLLGDGQPRPAVEIEGEARADGISRKGLFEGKKKLDIRAVRVGNRWYWQLKSAGPGIDEDTHPF